METFQNDDKSVNSGAKSRHFYNLLLCNYSMLHYKQIAIILFTIISLVIMVATIVVLASNKSVPPAFPPDTTSDPSTTTINPNGLIRIYTRKEWSAMPPKPGITDPNLKLPVEIVIIAHTGEPTNCTTTEECLRHVRNMQKYSMIINPEPLDDIPYNFLLGGDGSAYEGRGWLKKGEHTKFYNNRSIGIAFIGSFGDVEPPQQQLRIAQLLIEAGVYHGHLSPMYKLYGTRQLRPSFESPGNALYKIISKWPHWEELKP